MASHGAYDGIDVVLNLVGHGERGEAWTLGSDQFTGEVGGECRDPCQAFGR